MVLFVMLASAYSVLRKVLKSPFCSLNILVNGENPLEGTQQPELTEVSTAQYDQLACGKQRHDLQMQSPVSGTRGWVLPHLVLLGIPCFTVHAQDH